MTTARVELPPKLIPVFAPPRGELRYRVSHGGRGSAKSFSFAKMAAVWGYSESIRVLCVREFQNSIKESFHAELKKAIYSEPWLEAAYDIGVDYLRSNRNGTEFIFKGIRNNPHNVKSLSNIDLCIVEEAEDVNADGWMILEPTIRNPGSEIWVIFNPKDEDSATDKRFRQGKPPRCQIAEVNWRDNPWFPKELEELRQYDLQNYDKRVYEHVWEGKTLSKTGAEIYYNFDTATHVSEDAEYDSALPIMWTHDFNIGVGKPMSSALCQIRKEDGKPILCVFDEIIIPTADTNEIVQEFSSRHEHKNVVIYGDSSGKSRDTRSKTTDYLILSDAGYVNQRIPNANPPIRERHNAVNALLKAADGSVRLKVHPRCKTVIKGLKTVKIKPGSQYIEEETYWQHVTTALGYLVNVEFPVRKPLPLLTNIKTAY